MSERTAEIDRQSEQLTEQLAELMQESDRRLCLAESCTGGGIAEMVTRLPGSSNWFDCGWVTYSNSAKEAMLGVEPAVIERFGAVSEDCVREMVCGALERSIADYSIAVSGVAGPGGGSAQKPVGTVWIAWAFRPVPGMACEAVAHRFQFEGDRQMVRAKAIRAALSGLLHQLREEDWPSGGWIDELWTA